MSGLQRQALERVAVLVRIALDPAVPETITGQTALRVCGLIRDYRLLPELSAHVALVRALGAMIVMAEIATEGCACDALRGLCASCSTYARGAIAEAKRTMMHPLEGGG